MKMSRFDRMFANRPRNWRVSALVVAGAFVASLTVLVFAVDRSNDNEVSRLTTLLQLRDGMTLAEIGAGTGWLTVEMARRMGPAGGVYSTEVSPRRLDQIRDAAANAGLTNVTAVAAGEQSANLPAACCDAIFMRRVYHHFADPSAITHDIHGALVEGGRLVIIDFDFGVLSQVLSGIGIDRAWLIAQVTAGGLELVSVEDWPGWGHYAAVFEKSGE